MYIYNNLQSILQMMYIYLYLWKIHINKTGCQKKDQEGIITDGSKYTLMNEKLT